MGFPSQVPQTKLGLIGWAILTLIGHKQTNKQTDRQAKFMYRCALKRIWDAFNKTYVTFTFYTKLSTFNGSVVNHAIRWMKDFLKVCLKNPLRRDFATNLAGVSTFAF